MNDNIENEQNKYFFKRLKKTNEMEPAWEPSFAVK